LCFAFEFKKVLSSITHNSIFKFIAEKYKLLYIFTNKITLKTAEKPYFIKGKSKIDE